jgi:hypothetical protein
MAEWSKNPTVPGPYWWCHDGCMAVVELDHASHSYDTARREKWPLYQYEPGIERAVSIRQKIGCWYGPIEYPPDPPEGWGGE